MPRPNHDSDTSAPMHGMFATTHWSVVVAASGERESTSAAAALARLCETYWYPLYAYVRRRGRDPHQAQDLTQEFFAQLLQRANSLRADPLRGKFRFYLLGALKHFLADAHDRATAQKRGSGQTMISIDERTAEERYQLEPVDTDDPEKLFERRWALTLLDQAQSRLRSEYAASGKSQTHDQLEPFLSDAESAKSYDEVACKLGLSASATKSAIHRLRRRHRELVREEIAHTVTNANEVEDEIRHLITVVAR